MSELVLPEVELNIYSPKDPTEITGRKGKGRTVNWDFTSRRKRERKAAQAQVVLCIVSNKRRGW